MSSIHESMIAEQSYPDIASAHRGVVRAVLDAGATISLGDSASIGANRTTLELNNYQLHISDPTRRTLPSEGPFDLSRGLARFLWLASGNDRLMDIELYDAGASRFSDDGLRIPGSNFGTRLFCPQPGLNPISQLLQLLRVEPDTRRGSIPIYFSGDVGRNSRDIPCALAVHFRVHASRLSMTLIMRSNNAFRLFPYNVFEFSMLQEAIARELQMDVGTYVHYAISMHVYQDDLDAARQYCAAVPEGSGLSAFASMPTSHSPLQQISLVAGLEAKFRNAFVLGGQRAVDDVLRQASDALPDYWHAYFLRLALGLSTKASLSNLAKDIERRLGRLAVYPFCARGRP